MGRVTEENRFLKAVGKRLGDTRRRKRITQAALARRLRITTVYVSHIENGHRTPNLLTLRDWVQEGLGTTMDKIFRGLR